MQNLYRCQSRKETSTKEKTKREGRRRTEKKVDFIQEDSSTSRTHAVASFLRRPLSYIYPKTEMWIGLNKCAQLMNQLTHCCEVVSTCLSILDQWIQFKYFFNFTVLAETLNNWLFLSNFASSLDGPAQHKSSLSSDASKSLDRTLQHVSNCLSYRSVPYLVVYGTKRLPFSFVYFRQRAREIREKKYEHEKRTQMGSVH